MVRNEQARFEAKVNRNGPSHPVLGTPCHLWTGSLGPNGYGAATWSGKTVRAHRVAWFIKHGSWPAHNACHTCDERRCVNAEHLWDGTQLENMRDMYSKGRGQSQESRRRSKNAGCANGQSKLTVDQVQQIKELWADRAGSQRAIGARFGVTGSHVCMIVNGRRRGKIKPE